MPLINEDVVVGILSSPEHPQHRELRDQLLQSAEPAYDSVGHMRSGALDRRQELIPTPLGSPVNRDAAIACLRAAEAAILQKGYVDGKQLRPHEFDVFAELDRREPWVGYEFECGFQSEQARRQAMEYALSVAERGVSFDREGEGDYKCEITFAPEEICRILDGSAQCCKFMKWLSDHRELTIDSNFYGVGTHVNFSLPSDYRDPPRSSDGYLSLIESVCKILNNTLTKLPVQWAENGGVNTRAALMGRSILYGGFNSRSDNSVAGAFIEGKLFRTTYDYDRFMEYVRVSAVFVRIACESMDYLRNNVISQTDAAVTWCHTLLTMLEYPDGNYELDFQTRHGSTLTGTSQPSVVSGGPGVDFNWFDRETQSAQILVTGRHLPDPFRLQAVA
jgi:hypothetical protein